MESLIIELKDTIAQLNKTIATQDARIQELMDKISELTDTITNKDDTINKFQKMLFASKSEKHMGKDNPFQLTLFNYEQADKLSSVVVDNNNQVISETEPVVNLPEDLLEATKSQKTKPRKSKSSFTDKYGNLPERIIKVDNLTDEEKTCSVCGTKMVPIGTELLRSEIVYTPAKLERVSYVGVTYGCPTCKEEGEHSVFVKNKNCPPALLPPSFVSESLAAHVFYDKFYLALPYYRQEQDFNQFGTKISRATMANWAIKCWELYLKVVVDYFHRLFLKRSFIMMDETTWQVLKEPEREPDSKSYVWLARTGEDGEQTIVIYFYDPTRNGDVAVEFLEGMKAGYYLMVDGFQGYNKLKDSKRCVCYAHLRRKFLEAIPKGKEDDYTLPAVQGYLYCNKLFDYERKYREKGYNYQQIYKHRLKDEKPILEAFLAWIDIQKRTSRDSWNKALTYAANRKSDMMTYLEDGRCSLSNNLSENSIRPVTLLRKNSLFNDSQDGAHASMAILTIFEMAKIHNLNQYEYMKYLLQKRPYEGMPDEELEKLVPWNEEVQKACAKGAEQTKNNS